MGNIECGHYHQSREIFKRFACHAGMQPIDAGDGKSLV
jgi:hypothetical protein